MLLHKGEEKKIGVVGDSNLCRPLSSPVHSPLSHRSCGNCTSLIYVLYEDSVCKDVHISQLHENYVKVSHDCPTKRDGSSFKILVMQQSSRNIKLLKYKLCPPSFVSRILLSWQLVDPYLYESSTSLLDSYR